MRRWSSISEQGEFTAVGELTSEGFGRGAFEEIDDVAALLDRFEDIQTESIGYDGEGHRIWEVKTRD